MKFAPIRNCEECHHHSEFEDNHGYMFVFCKKTMRAMTRSEYVTIKGRGEFPEYCPLEELSEISKK